MNTAACTVLLPLDAPSSTAALVRVEVLDTSRADGDARLLGCAELVDVALEPGALLPPVLVDVPDPDPAASLTVRVHVDLAGTGQVSEGDLLTTQAVPVLTRGAPDEVQVPVTRV